MLFTGQELLVALYLRACVALVFTIPLASQTGLAPSAAGASLLAQVGGMVRFVPRANGLVLVAIAGGLLWAPMAIMAASRGQLTSPLLWPFAPLYPVLWVATRLRNWRAAIASLGEVIVPAVLASAMLLALVWAVERLLGTRALVVLALAPVGVVSVGLSLRCSRLMLDFRRLRAWSAHARPEPLRAVIRAAVEFKSDYFVCRYLHEVRQRSLVAFRPGDLDDLRQIIEDVENVVAGRSRVCCGVFPALARAAVKPSSIAKWGWGVVEQLCLLAESLRTAENAASTAARSTA
jgi:hypothetical protein